MLGTFGRRAVEAVVALFALLGFFFVPLGRHTGFEHAKAVFSTPAAGRAVKELGQAVVGLRMRIFGEATGAKDTVGAPKPPKDDQPKPIPPELE